MSSNFENIAKIKAGAYDLAATSGKAEAIRVLISVLNDIRRIQDTHPSRSPATDDDYVGPYGKGVGFGE